MLSVIRRTLAAILLAACARGRSAAEEAFVAIPPDQAAQYRIDFAKHFFASPEAEKAGRAALDSALGKLEALKGRIAASPGNLERALDLSDRVQVEFEKHFSDLYLRYAVNIRNRASLNESSALDAQVTSRTAFVREELIRMPDATLAAFLGRDRGLARHRFAIESIRRDRPHVLSLKEEELLAATEPATTGWQSQLYGTLIGRTPFATVETREGPRSPWRDRVELAASPDPRVRREAFEKRYAGLASQRDLYAFTLMELVRARQKVARLRHYEDAASETYLRSGWSKGDVTRLLQEIARRADLYKRYQRLRAERVRRMTGEPEAHVWDMSARPAGMTPPRFTIGEGTQILRAAVSGLGPDYGRELAALLDPANGRMDIVPGQGRFPGGFSRGFIGTDSVFYSSGFNGSYNDLRVLMHESTHAVHRELMTHNRVPPAYASGPHFLFEAFAIFNELLLPDFLARQEQDPSRRRYFLEQFLDGKGMEIFVVAPEAALEQAVHDEVSEGRIAGADELDALTKQTYSLYSIWPERHDELKSQWMAIRLMYEDPFYDVNYVQGALLALELYALYTREPEQFVPRYLALMRNGFDAPPEELLKRFLGVDPNDPKRLGDAFRVIEEKVHALEGD